MFLGGVQTYLLCDDNVNCPQQIQTNQNLSLLCAFVGLEGGQSNDQEHVLAVLCSHRTDQLADEYLKQRCSIIRYQKDNLRMVNIVAFRKFCDLAAHKYFQK